MYETMAFWETAQTGSDQPPCVRDYAQIWRAADKIVYSTTLEAVSSARTRIERDFDAGAIRQMKASATRDVSIGGPALAAQALAAGLVDECRVFLTPVVVGGGTRALPAGLRMRLDLIDERRFSSGAIYLRYRAGADGTFVPWRA
jgi:dihydrofolate reductase